MSVQHLFDCIASLNKTAETLRTQGWSVSFNDQERVSVSAQFYGEPPTYPPKTMVCGVEVTAPKGGG